MLDIDETIARIQHKIKTNKIEVNPVISMEEINKYESNTKLELPIILKRFYTEICNGCQMIDAFRLSCFNELRIDIELSKQSFNFSDYWVWEGDDDVTKDRIEEALYGNIELISIGDGQSWHIILNGEEEGQMWFFTDAGIQPCFPRQNLLSWFEFWLDGNEDYFAEFVY